MHVSGALRQQRRVSSQTRDHAGGHNGGSEEPSTTPHVIVARLSNFVKGVSGYNPINQTSTTVCSDVANQCQNVHKIGSLAQSTPVANHAITIDFCFILHVVGAGRLVLPPHPCTPDPDTA